MSYEGNFSQITTLEGLSLSRYGRKELKDYFCSPDLLYLNLYRCRPKNLDGIETSKKIEWIQLGEMSLLEDISALEQVADTLTALCIDTCRKIKDLSVLSKLKKLKHLEILNCKEVEDLSFLNELKELETFVFNIKVKDGDLSPCLKIPFVSCESWKKHYNVKKKDLPQDERYYRWAYCFIPHPLSHF